jgi:hypothetical protein
MPKTLRLLTAARLALVAIGVLAIAPAVGVASLCLNGSEATTLYQKCVGASQCTTVPGKDANCTPIPADIPACHASARREKVLFAYQLGSCTTANYVFNYCTRCVDPASNGPVKIKCYESRQYSTLDCSGLELCTQVNYTTGSDTCHTGVKITPE